MTQFTISASNATVSKTWSGSIQVAYACPRCKDQLKSEGDVVFAQDSCPRCKATWGFDDAIQADCRNRLQAAVSEKRKKQEEAEERRRQKEGARRSANEDKAQRERAARQQEVIQELRQSLKSEEESERYARDLTRARTNTDVLTVLAILGELWACFGAFSLAAQATTGDKADQFVMVGLLSVAALVSTVLIYGVIRCLFAMHALLVLILDEIREAKGIASGSQVPNE